MMIFQDRSISQFLIILYRVDVVFNINENENVDEGLNIEESEYSQDQDDVSLPEVKQ